MNELTRRIRTWLQAFAYLIDRVVAVLQLFFIDVGVIDPVDVIRPQIAVVDGALRLIVTEAQGFEEVHVDDRSACRHDHVDHSEFDHVSIDMHASACRRGAGER